MPAAETQRLRSSGYNTVHAYTRMLVIIGFSYAKETLCCGHTGQAAAILVGASKPCMKQ